MARFDSAQRTKILEAAIPVFAEHGLKATTRLVAQAAQVNSALIYYYFENKDTLFTEALRLVMSGLLNHLDKGPKTFSSPRQRLSFLVDGLYDYYGAHPARIQLMGVAITLYPDLLGKVIRDFVGEKLALPLQVLEEGMRKGEFKRLHPLVVWWSILGVCLLNLQMRKVMKNVDPNEPRPPLPVPEKCQQETIDLLCEGLLASPDRKARK